MGFLDDVGHFFTNIGDKVSGAVSGVYHDITGTVNNIVAIPGQIAQTVVPAASQTIQNVTNLGNNLVSTAGKTLSDSLGSIMNSPMLIVLILGAVLIAPKIINKVL